jgi:hypothetical protein
MGQMMMCTLSMSGELGISKIIIVNAFFHIIYR